jgi:hypothetical protein
LPSSAATASATATFKVIVTVPTQVMITPAQTMPVTVKADAGLTVACGTSTTFLTGCTLANWSFSQVSGNWIATQPVTVRLVSWAAQLPQTSFTVTVAGNDMLNPVQLMNVRGQVTSPTPTVLGDGQYAGWSA